MMVRPSNSEYYEASRTSYEQFSQGDIFEFPISSIEGIAKLASVSLEVTLAAMFEELGMAEAMETMVDAASEAAPSFPRLVSAPLVAPVLSMLITRTDSMRAPGSSQYGHNFMTMCPIVHTAELLRLGSLTPGLVDRARRDDDLSNVMYLPSHPEIAESVVFLHSPVTIDRSLLNATRRVVQLQGPAVHQLQGQLVRLYTGEWPSDDQAYRAHMD